MPPRGPGNTDPRISSLDVHMVPRKPPRSIYDMPPTTSGRHSAPSTALRPGHLGQHQQQHQQPHAMHRKKSTKELVAQFEAASSSGDSPTRPRYPADRAPQSTPRRRVTLTKRVPGDGLGVPYSSMPRVSSNLTPPQRPRSEGLTPPRPPEEYSPPKKDRSPLRESLRNLFGIFKKGKSPQGKGKEGENGEGYSYQREKEVFKDRETWHGETSETTARRMQGGHGSGTNTPEKALPPVTPEQRRSGPAPLRSGILYYLTAERQWTKRQVSLEPPFLYMTDPVLATPSLAMRLETLTSVHSLPRSSALTLPPIRQKEFPEEPYVFELEFEGGNRVELFALESASSRSSWVSVFWDAVLSMQPGPSLPPASQQNDDPFLSPSLADPMANHRPLHVVNGPVPDSPNSTLPSPRPMPRADSGDSIPPTGANGAQGSGGKSKLRQSSLPHDALGVVSPNSIGLVVSDAPPTALPDRPSSRPLPIVPQDRAPSPDKPGVKPDATPLDEKGAEIIRFPSAFSRRSRTTPGSPMSHGLFSPQTDAETTPTSPPTSPSPKTLRSPTVTVERKETHDTIRLSSIRSPSPPLSRRTSYATTTNNSPRSPSIQTLAQMSVVRMRLAKLEVGEAKVIPTSPKNPQGQQENAPKPPEVPSPKVPTPKASPKKTNSITGITLTPNRRLSTNLSSFHTPPLTVRKRGNTLMSRFPLPLAIGEVSSAGEESSTDSEPDKPNRTSTVGTIAPILRASQLAEAQDSNRDSSASGQTHFTMARSSQHPEGLPLEWPDSTTDSGSTSGDADDKGSRSSMLTARSSTVPTPIEQASPVDLDPVIAMLEPLPGHYSDLSEKMDDVKTGLGNVAGDVHKALQGIAELRTDIATVGPQQQPVSPMDEEAWQHVRRQMSELIMLVSESMANKSAQQPEAKEEEKIQTMRNLGKRDKETKEGEISEGDGKTQEGGDNDKGPTPEQLASLFEPLLEQQKHLHLQQTDTIRYLNELNPWLQKLALTAEKGDEVPADVQRIAKALGIEKPKVQEGEESPKEGPSFVVQIMEKLDGIRTIVEANQQSRAAMDAVLQTLAEQRQEQEKLLRSVAADLSNDIRGERLRFVDAMKEATSLNVQVHLEEFKKQLNQEVLRMTQDVGHLRDEKMKLEQAIAELFAIKAKHGEHLYQLQQATQQAQQQAQARPQQKPISPPPTQQFLHPQQVPGMMYNVQGPYPSMAPPQAQQPRYPVPLQAGRPVQMPAPLAGQPPARQGTHASRPLPAAGPRTSAAGGPRSAR